jgi:DNA-binding response OmpR family regulator
MLPEQEVISFKGPSSGHTILVIEDDKVLGEMIALALSAGLADSSPIVADSDTIWTILNSVHVDLLLIDAHLCGVDGLQLSDYLHAQPEYRAIPVIILSCCLDWHQQELEKRHLRGLKEPFELDELFTTVRAAFN